MHQYTVKILQFKNVHNLNSKFINLLCCREPLITESKHNSETSEEVGQPRGRWRLGCSSGYSQRAVIAICLCLCQPELNRVPAIHITGCW